MKHFAEGSTKVLQPQLHLVRPRTHFKKGQLKPDAPRHVLKTPDADNLAKAVKDGLSGVLYHDDGQVAELVVRKRRAAQGDAPRVEVCLYTLDPLGGK